MKLQLYGYLAPATPTNQPTIERASEREENTHTISSPEYICTRLEIPHDRELYPNCDTHIQANQREKKERIKFPNIHKVKRSRRTSSQIFYNFVKNFAIIWFLWVCAFFVFNFFYVGGVYVRADNTKKHNKIQIRPPKRKKKLVKNFSSHLHLLTHFV